jgi:hypothetical protein
MCSVFVTLRSFNVIVLSIALSLCGIISTFKDIWFRMIINGGKFVGMSNEGDPTRSYFDTGWRSEWLT